MQPTYLNLKIYKNNNWEDAYMIASYQDQTNCLQILIYQINFYKNKINLIAVSKTANSETISVKNEEDIYISKKLKNHQHFKTVYLKTPGANLEELKYNMLFSLV